LETDLDAIGDAFNFFDNRIGQWIGVLPDSIELLLYPIVCDLRTGQIDFDDYNGRWGERQQLDRFLQAYAVERAKIESRKRGHTVTEQQLTDGSIKLTIQVAGGAA
jgi:hypothetical protein